MTTFTIDCDNDILAFASLQEAQAADLAGAEYFGSEKGTGAAHRILAGSRG